MRLRRPIPVARRPADGPSADPERIARIVSGHEWASTEEWREAVEALADFSDDAIEDMLRAKGVRSPTRGDGR
ncbi:MAG: hypothetical protein EA406_11050 [Rhodospirillales bacterium]|nr:MAG: hypothetical protein EA406_11050 [Rhodospirillales bacterium]